MGIDDAVTSVEALEALALVSLGSTVVHTISSFIYHPKFYLFDGASHAVAVIGSSNLTRDGLFRNVEMAVALELDLSAPSDASVFAELDAASDGLLDITQPNVQRLDTALITMLEGLGVVQRESQLATSSRARAAKNLGATANPLAGIFPPFGVPQAPPTANAMPSTVGRPNRPAPTPAPALTASTFIMQLSAFDSSHRSNVPGTPEILVPQRAVGFFPALPSTARAGRRHPDVEFDVLLNTSIGNESLSYRLWFYQRRTEWRLNVRHATIDQTTPGGGDLLVIDRLVSGVYEATVYAPSDPAFAGLLMQCTSLSQEKKWTVL